MRLVRPPVLNDALGFLVFASILLWTIGLSRPALADWRQVQLDPRAAGYTAAEVSQRIANL
ncbi:MAG: hypothetical protein KGQ93_13650 [Cyanobacteria bacterium REEB459]|nr:hypothetical protein [Cyanobacteria bacterium REEB459]